MKNEQQRLQQAARRRLKLDPIEKTALIATGRSTVPVQARRDPAEGEIFRADLINRLVNSEQ